MLQYGHGARGSTVSLDKFGFSVIMSLESTVATSMLERVNDPKDYHVGKFSNRSMVRTIVFQILYQEELNPGSLETLSEAYIAAELPQREPLLKFARQLLGNTVTHRETIDSQLSSFSRNWTLARMSPIDRSILRLAASEILYTDTPKPIVINEAIELAKQFGTKDSPAFVNGILDQVQCPLVSRNEPQVLDGNHVPSTL